MDTDSSKLPPTGVLSWSEHELEIITPEHKYLIDRSDSERKLNHGGPPLPRWCHSYSGAASSSGDIFLFGGVVNNECSNDTWAIRVSGDLDSPIEQGGSSMGMRLEARLIETTGEAPSPRRLHRSVLADELFVVWGGFNKRTIEDTSVYTLNITTCHWTKLDIQPAPSPRDEYAACLCGSKFTVFGGLNSDHTLDDLWSLDLSELQSNPKWEQIEFSRDSPAPSARCGHEVVEFENRLYLFGGEHGGKKCNDTWCFDMTTRTWTELACSGDVPAPRSLFAAALIRDTVYISGGSDADRNMLADSWRFQIHEQKWYRLPDLDCQPSVRTDHVAATVGRRIFLLGGKQEDIRTIHCLDTDSKPTPVLTPVNITSWSIHALEIATPEDKYLDNQPNSTTLVKGVSPPLPRFSHSSTISSSLGEIYIFGGIVDGKPTNGTWTVRISEALDLLPEQGGNTMGVKMTAGLVETTGDAPSPRGLHQSVLNGYRLVVWGGIPSHNRSSGPPKDNSVYVLNTSSNKWTKRSIRPAPSARFWHAACLCGDKLMVFGGAESHDRVLNDLWSLDLTKLDQRNLAWERVEVADGSPSPAKRGGHAMITYHNKLFVFGGFTGKGSLNDMWCFDLTTRVWTELKYSGDTPTPRAFFASTLVDDVMYVSGGVGKGAKALGDTYSFKLNEQVWYKLPDLDLQPSAMWGHSLVAHEGRVYLIGGTRNHKEPNDMADIHCLNTDLIEYPKGGGDITIKRAKSIE
ncbi:Tip elongation aberrant protein 1 [Rhizoctonia solani]|uniref:Tip elongation aberrant protein 1 n=1 Tax=Rhizoctonia solani TaxID=456999 RepID=A0A0K6G9P8_9AGAM|nr:Tip elongation aberrant protein 1 [Rhizoctonia solani]